VDSHRLIRLAGDAGCQDAVVEALFDRYFLKGQDIGDRAVLAEAAAAAGMDASAVEAAFADDKTQTAVQQEDTEARQLGISGVPFFIFAGQYALSGAQPPEAIAQMVSLAMQDAQDAAAQ